MSRMSLRGYAMVASPIMTTEKMTERDCRFPGMTSKNVQEKPGIVFHYKMVINSVDSCIKMQK